MWRDIGTGGRSRSSLASISIMRRVCSERWTAESLRSSILSNSRPNDASRVEVSALSCLCGD